MGDRLYKGGDSMIKIAICDDIEYMRQETKKYLLDYSFNREMDYTVAEYESGEELLQSGVTYDLIFMDYEFEGQGDNGISISRKIRKENSEVTIIFLSSYPQVVFESFEVGTFRFLTKPIDKDKFYSALDSFVNMTKQEKTLQVRDGGEHHLVKESTILYIEGDGKNCVLHLIDEKRLLYCHETLAAIEQRISPEKFYRCIKSYVINLKYVSHYNRAEVVMNNGEKIPLSRKKYKELTEKMTKFIIGESP